MNTPDKPVPLSRWTWQQWRPRLWAPGIFCVWGIASIHAIIRDSIPGFATVFYATPPIVLAVLAFGVVFVLADPARIRGDMMRKGLNLLTVAAGVICISQWIGQDFRARSSRPHPTETVKLVFWNVGSGTFAAWPRIAEQAKQFDADVLAFAEMHSPEAQSPQFWKQYLPEHSAIPLGAGLLLLVKGTATNRESESLNQRGNYRRLSLEIRSHQFDLVIGDLVSDPFRSRGPALRELFQHMQKQSDTPTVVAGDFNTPPSSVFFDKWRTDWSRAWDTAGGGYQSTWPFPVPVLTLDHMWGNQGIRFATCRHAWSTCSDHRPIMADFTVNDRPASAP